jgi:hypothetical protein
MCAVPYLTSHGDAGAVNARTYQFHARFDRRVVKLMSPWVVLTHSSRMPRDTFPDSRETVFQWVLLGGWVPQSPLYRHLFHLFNVRANMRL